MPRALENIGETCYFNAVLQQLARAPGFGDAVDAVAAAADAPEPTLAAASATSAADVRLLQALRQTLAALRDVDASATTAAGAEAAAAAARAPVAPRAFAASCEGLGLAYDVLQQNDAAEFLGKVLEALDRASASEASDTATGAFAAAVARSAAGCFQGRLEHRRSEARPSSGAGEGDAGAGDAADSDGWSHWRTSEPFFRVDLEVTGGGDVGDALRAFTEEVTISGDGGRMIRRTTRFAELPPVLTLHLKRFALDYATFEVTKVLDRCAFPKRLDMRPYCADGGFNDQSFVYSLGGVVIHVGFTATDGHYVALVRVMGKWFICDDARVEVFDVSHLEKFFGGAASAVLLFYDKTALLR